MSTIQLLKEPGYISDLIFIFYLKFNTKLCSDMLEGEEKQAEASKFHQDLLDQIGDISDDLYVFFHAIENRLCFMSTCYFKPYQYSFATSFDFKYLQKELSDRDTLIRNLIKFYLYDLSEDEIDACMQSNRNLFAYIKESRYSDEEKSKLYEFFIHPEPYIQTLHYELMAKELWLSQYYEKNYQKILDVHNQTTDEILSEHLKGIVDLSLFKKAQQQIYTSYCLVNKFCINGFNIKNGIIYLLGYDYLSILTFVKNQKKEPSLQDFGNALCEESRIKILQLLREREEVTCKDLERIFSFSGSTAYHHMSMMLKIGLIKSRNQGKTILYSLNRRYFNTIIGVLSKYSNK